MAIEVKYLSSATSTFLNLQGGAARPYWEANITVSGDASTYSGVLGAAYNANNHIVSMGSIDKEKPASISGLSRIIAGDITLTLDNKSGLYSPRATASIFSDAGGSARDYLHSTINIWAGFENTSGTAYTIQRGSFLLTKLRVDSHNNLAYITAEDTAKIPLSKYIALPDLSGTAITWTPPSGITTKAIMSDLLSGIGLTAGQYDLATGREISGYEITNTKIGDELAKLAQANDGYIYTNGKGQIVFTLNQPTWGGKSSDLALNSNDRIMQTRYSINVKDLVNKVQVSYGTGTMGTRTAENTGITKGQERVITNEVIQKPAMANAISSRLAGQFRKYRPFIEIDNIWLPSLEVGNILDITDTGTYQTAVSYEIYRIREDVNRLSTKIYGIDITENESYGTNKQKWGFCSTFTSGTCTTVSGSCSFVADLVGLWHFSGADASTAIVDEKGHTGTAGGNAQIDTAQSKFGGSSLLLDGVGDYVELDPSTAWTFGAGNFTIDFQVRFASTDPDYFLWGYTEAGKFDHSVLKQSSGVGGNKLRITFEDVPTGTKGRYQMTNAWSVTTGQWYHLAFVRDTATAHIFIDGIKQALTVTTSFGVNVILSAATGPNIGKKGTKYMNGWIDEFRIVKGTAVWTTNFTPTGGAYDTASCVSGTTTCTSGTGDGHVFAEDWHSGFAFVCRDITTSVNPAFDAEGNNDNTIDTGYTSSGAGYSGIELPYLAY